MKEYPWYETPTKNSQLMQGDFISNCPILLPPKDFSGNDDFEIKVKNFNVIVMSQSCDLENHKLNWVLVCAVWDLDYLATLNEHLRSKKNKEKLRRGNFPNYHLLNKCEIEGSERDFQIVDFRNSFSISYNFLKEFSSKQSKLRLLPPYREHLSQAFARFFMRVGLPIDIENF